VVRTVVVINRHYTRKPLWSRFGCARFPTEQLAYPVIQLRIEWRPPISIPTWAFFWVGSQSKSPSNLVAIRQALAQRRDLCRILAFQVRPIPRVVMQIQDYLLHSPRAHVDVSQFFLFGEILSCFHNGKKAKRRE
jgi:hypothetical protein